MSRVDRYQDPELYELLSVEYVLGTLRGRARQRFTRLIEERRYIRDCVEQWERRLHPLNSQISPIKPKRRVWRNIKQEIALASRQHGRSRMGLLWENIFIWRTSAIIGLAALVTFFVAYDSLRHDRSEKVPSYVAVLTSQHNEPMLVATVDRKEHKMTVKMIDKSIVTPDRDLELWCLMKDSEYALSMGVLARDQETVLALTEQDWNMMGRISQLAISAEPMGGSPTGNPTGPIMYKGDFVSLI